VLVGGNGLDAVTGGTGRDLLIGGNGADALLAGGGEDVLVAGRTFYDTNPAALDALRVAWQRTDRTFSQRVSSLSNGNGVTGGFALRTDGGSQTVFDDSAADTITIDLLFGGGSADYFLYNYQQAGTQDIVLDLNGADARADIDPS
jgi:Ca2+-binding RTX toxin-like protein